MQLICGDCIEEMQKLIDNGIKVDLVVTSPPYDNLRIYNNTLEWNFEIFKKVADKLYQIVKEGGVIVWVVGDSVTNGSKTGTSFRQALYFKEIGFNLHDVMIFAKKNPIPQIFHKRYTNAFEYMFVLTKGKPKTCNPLKEPCKYRGFIPTNGYKQISKDKPKRKKKDIKVKDFKVKSNIWYYGCGGNNYGHPAIFPLDLAKDHIISWTNPNDLILDPFMGSGTTGVACIELNRDFIGIEKVKEYYDIAVERMNDNLNQTHLGDFI